MQRIEAEKLKTVLILDSTDINNLLSVYSHSVFNAKIADDKNKPSEWHSVTIARQMLTFVGLTEKSISDAYNEAENRYNHYINFSQLVDIYDKDLKNVIEVISMYGLIIGIENCLYSKTEYKNNTPQKYFAL
jgi:hypothetical protein